MILRQTLIRISMILSGLLVSVGAYPSDISLLGVYSSGDFGDALESRIQTTWLRFATGDRYQFRVALPYLRIETTDVLVQPALGSLPVGKRQGQNMNTGNRSGGQLDESDAIEPSPQGAVDTPAETISTQIANGLGDVWLSGFIRLLGGGARVYRLDTGLEVKAPTSDTKQLLGTGEWDLRFAVSGEYRFWTASVFSIVGWNRLGDPDWIELNDALDFLAGAESDLLWDRFILSGWLEANQEVVAGTGTRSALGLGFRSTGRFRWRVLATAGLTGPAEDFSVAFGISMGVEPPKTGLGGIGL
jgi:hypothetical protein